MRDVTRSSELLQSMSEVIFDHVQEHHDLRVSVSLTYETQNSNSLTAYSSWPSVCLWHQCRGLSQQEVWPYQIFKTNKV